MKASLSSVDIHFQALCNAVENEKIEKIRSILEHNPNLNTTSINADKLSPLDIAFMLGNVDILNMLMEHQQLRNAQENDTAEEFNVHHEVNEVFVSSDAIIAHLSNLIGESKKQVEKFGQLIKMATDGPDGNTNPALKGVNSLTQAQLRECEKQQSLWTKRMNSLRKMRNGFISNFCPNTPTTVNAKVLGLDVVQVCITSPGDEINRKGLMTKFKVQWSTSETFGSLVGERVFHCTNTNGRDFVCTIQKLQTGTPYYIRVAFGNLKGYGPFSAAISNPVIPSSWRSLEAKPPRLQNQMEVSENILKSIHQQNSDIICDNRIDNPNVIQGGQHQNQHTQSQHHHRTKKKGLFQQLLSVAGMPKFHRNPHANRLYVCSLLYHEDKILMTNEEHLPLISVLDDSCSFSLMDINIQQEFHWFSKLSYMWKDVEILKMKLSHLDKKNSGDVGPNMVRSKILHALSSLQDILSGLGGDLGTAYRTPIYLNEPSKSGSSNNHPAVVFCLIRHVKDPKSVVSLSLKWVPMSRVQKLPNHGNHAIDSGAVINDHNLKANSRMESLCLTIREQMIFQQVSEMTLGDGLYLFYMQAYTSVEGIINLVVPNTSPSILPYVKVRENAHVTSEEWNWVQLLQRKNKKQSKLPLIASSHKTSGNFVGQHHASPTTNFLDGEGEEGSDFRMGICKEPFQQMEATAKDSSVNTESQRAFGLSVLESIHSLFTYLDIPASRRDEHRIYAREVIELSPNVSAIIVLPPPQSICFLETPDSKENNSQQCSINIEERNDLLSIPLNTFELIHMSAYNQQLLSNYCRGNTLLEMEVQILKQNQREILDNQEIDILTQKMNTLGSMQRQLDETWRPLRWVWDILSSGRDKHNECGVVYKTVLNWFENNEPIMQLNPDSNSNASVKNRNLRNVVENFIQDIPMSLSTKVSPHGRNIPTSNKRSLLTGQLADYVSQTYSSKSSLPASLSSSPHLHRRSELSTSPMEARRTNSSSQRSSSTSRQPMSMMTAPERISRGPETDEKSNKLETNANSSSVLQVYAAYDTGLASGTSVLINLSESTSSREVVDLVVKQLNMAVIMKGKDQPIYDNDTLRNFCLVAVIGSRERCLRDDFKPLQLQNPWRKGKLFVRVKSDVLAAIERQSFSTNPGSQTVSNSETSSTYVPGTTLSTTTTIL